MNGYLERPDQIAILIEQENGHPVGSWELAHLLNDELAALSGQALDQSLWYYGDFVIVSRDEFLSSVLVQNVGSIVGDSDTLTINQIGGLSTANGAIFKQIMWNQVAAWDAVNGHFYGWKFNRARGYVTQSFTLTDGAGWSLSSGVYTHVSGTTEQIYLGAWTLNSLIRVTVTFTGITQGSVSLQMDTSGNFGTITEDGTYTFEVQTNGTDGALFFVPTNDFNGSYAESSVIIQKYTYL